VKHAILLGGHSTALAVARSLGSRGVPVVVSGLQSGIAMRSRFCAAAYTYPDPLQWAGFWKELLLGGEAPLAGGVLLATCDEAVEFIAKNHAPLAARYLLDMRRPELHLALLDKQRTLELGRAAGIATPNFWSVAGAGDLQRALAEVRYPVLVKPIHSHVFRAIFGRKHFIAHEVEDLTRNACIALDAGVAFMICEMIPGPDSLLSSYYTYLTPEGEALFDFTKRVVRRYPLNEGFGTYHATEWLPRTAEAGRRFFQGIGFQGLGNVEFKLDRRDGQLKLIECNARFTAAQALVARAGIDTAWIAYSRAIGGEAPRIRSYREHLYLWNPKTDYRAFRQLHRQGKLSLATWLRSLARPKITPYFQWNDPVPSLVMAWDLIRGCLARPYRPLVRPVQRPA
jgi:D-aspartate ligase